MARRAAARRQLTRDEESTRRTGRGLPGAAGRRAVAAVASALVAGAIIWLEAWHGPSLLSLSAGHGVDTGDLVAAPLVLLALALARSRCAGRPTAGRSWAVPASVAILGVLLLLAHVRETTSGAMVPSGAATLAGTVWRTVGIDDIPVGRWTHVALTYDGADFRLYVNGRVVARDGARGRISPAGGPLWIGADPPFGGQFAGLIDDVRVYDRALSGPALRSDMAQPVHAAQGLVAGYAFDAGQAADSSGNRNSGDVRGATRARGRHGGALRFDGVRSLVRVAPSTSLNLAYAMTLSAWIRPVARQTGRRAIVQRHTDAYFLASSTDRVDVHGVYDAVRIALVAVAAAWFCLLVAAGRAPDSPARRRTWWLPVVLFAAGSALDAAVAPAATATGPLFVAIWLAGTAPRAWERASFGMSAAVLAALTGWAGRRAGDGLFHHPGATVRTAALGGLFVLAALAAIARRPGTRPSA